jgi:hypothetical protein
MRLYFLIRTGAIDWLQKGFWKLYKLKNIQVYRPTIYSTFKYAVDLIKVPDERSV